MPSPRELLAQFNLLECGICTEAFEPSGDLCPHVLACGHSFCFKDILQVVKRAEAGSMCCPTCLKKSSLGLYEDSFPPKNFSMLEAISFEGDPTAPVESALPEDGKCRALSSHNARYIIVEQDK